MKKFLAPIVAIAAVAGFSSAVFAQADTQTIKQEGSVKGNCTLAVENGKLPADAGFVNSIESSVKGKISTVCNTKASSLTVALESPANETVNGQAITRAYKLEGGTGAYVGFPTTATFGTVANSKADISNGFSAGASMLDVLTKVSAPTGQNLAAGDQEVKVKVTVSP